MKLLKIGITVLLTVGLVVFVIQSRQATEGNSEQVQVQKTKPKKTLVRAKGNPEAPIHIVEFIDFQCPSCGMASRLLDGYLKQYPDDLYIEVKYFPLRNHPHAMLASKYSECALNQDKFWPVHDSIFNVQDEWKDLEDAKPVFDQLAIDAGVDMAQLDRCVQSARTEAIVLKDKNEGIALQIRSTPTFLWNGRLVVGYKALRLELHEYFKPAPNETGA